MNYYYNPYMMMPSANMMAAPAKAGMFSNLMNGVRGIKWGTLFNNAQRTLGFINQAIPVVKQVSPVVKNAKTMFRVMNEFKKVDEPVSNNMTPSQNYQATNTMNPSNRNQYTPETNQNYVDNGPTFFI